MKKKPKLKPRSEISKIERDIRDAGAAIGGTVIAIDPSSGSADSQPGYAVFKNGLLLRCGTLNIGKGIKLHLRLASLRADFDKLVTEFGGFDALIIENIPPFMDKAGGGFRSSATCNLHKSIGAVFACYPFPNVLEVTPMSWQAWLRKKQLEEWYKKDDAMDALMLGLCVLDKAGVVIHLEHLFEGYKSNGEKI